MQVVNIDSTIKVVFKEIIRGFEFYLRQAFIFDLFFQTFEVEFDIFFV